MIRYGNIEVPRAAVAQLATKLARDATRRERERGHSAFSLAGRSTTTATASRFQSTTSTTSSSFSSASPVPGLEPLAELLREQVETQPR
jgi:hypothetical protein